MKPFTTVAIIIFVLVAVMHALRLWLGWSVIVDGSAIPMWASVAGLVIAVVLAMGLWRDARVRADTPLASEKREVRAPGSKFTVQQGKHYQATISLAFFEQIASNDTIAGMLRDAGFSEVKVMGSGGTRTAEALWPGSDRTGELPPQMVKVTEIAA